MLLFDSRKLKIFNHNVKSCDVSSGLSAHQLKLQNAVRLLSPSCFSSPLSILWLCVNVRPPPFLFGYLSFSIWLSEFVGSADSIVKKKCTAQRRWDVCEVLAGYSTVVYLSTTSQGPARSQSQPHGCTVLCRYSSSWDSINKHADFLSHWLRGAAGTEILLLLSTCTHTLWAMICE